ncbi:hypothetical protein EMIT019CA3_100148 [Bacillus pseudomycoides]
MNVNFCIFVYFRFLDFIESTVIQPLLEKTPRKVYIQITVNKKFMYAYKQKS